MVAGRTGRDDIRFQSVPWASVYMNAWLADRYRVGHVFLIVTPLIFIRRRGPSFRVLPPSGSPSYKLSTQIDGRRMTRVRLAGSIG
jgi:hypothetical protein